MLARTVAGGETKMPVLERELSKNYIGILNDRIEEPRAIQSQTNSNRPVKPSSRADGCYAEPARRSWLAFCNHLFASNR